MRYAVAAAFAALALVPSAGTAVPSAGIRAQQLVNAICALGFRPAGSRGERRAGRLVAARFRSLGYRVSVQRFPIPRRLVSQNVVARTPGRIRAIVVAHLDGGPDTVAADDNASGVAAMLEVARQLRGTPGLLFAAVGAEERFQTGSPVHLGSLKLANGLSRAQRRGVRVAISLDMVGHGPELNVRGYEGSPNRSSRLMLAASRQLGLGATYMLGAGSDHVELTQAGIPATWLEWRPDACYDRPCDTPNRISARNLGTAVAVTVAALRAAVGTSQTATPPAASGTAYQDASWSPDGKQIVFVGNTDEPGQQPFGRLLLMDADGRNVREVVQRSGGVHFPAWSPRRDWIAFTDNNSPGAPNIFLIRPDGTQLHQLPCCGGCCPDWSPDGQKIVFAVGDEFTPSAIYVMRADGGGRRLVAGPPVKRSYTSATWSPNGRLLALAGNPDLTPDASLGFVGLVRAGGGHVRRLARGHYPRDLDWGPHGRKILFGEVGVVIMALDLRTKRVARMRYGSHPRWSPNGRRIVYERLGSIYVMNADGSHATRLIKGVPRQH